MWSTRRIWLAGAERHEVWSEANWLLCSLIRFSVQHAATAAALNLTRMVRWLAGDPIATTR